MEKSVFPIGELDIEVLDGDRGKNYPHQDELYEKGHCLFLSAANVTSSGFRFETTVFISKEKDEILRGGKLRRNDIVITTRGTVGNVAYYDECIPYEDIRINSGMLIVRCGKGINSEYIYYVLRSPEFQKQVRSIQTGSAQPQLPKSHFLKMLICVPEMETQNIIASILSALDRRIESNARINDNLQQQAQTLYAEHFCLRDGDSIPDGWSLISLGDVAVISNKSFNPLKQPETMLEHYSIPAFDETRYPVFELSTAIKSNKFVVDADCFMISKLNPTTKRVWRPYCMTDNAVCSTEFIVYKAKERMLTDFLYSLIDSVPFSDFMCSHVTGSTGSRQRTIPSDTLQYQFYLPTVEEIAAFSAVVAPMYAQIRINAMENARLKDLRDSLLPRLMSGEIEVYDVGI